MTDTNSTSPTTNQAKNDKLDQLKNISGTLTIAFLTYSIPIIFAAFFSPIEITYRYTAINSKSGYLFTLQNYSSNPIEDVAIYIETDSGIDEVYQDGAMHMSSTLKGRQLAIKLKDIPPKRETIVFAIAPLTSANSVKVFSEKNQIELSDASSASRRLWSIGSFISAIVAASLYFAHGIYLRTRISPLLDEVQKLHADIKDANARTIQLHETSERELKDIRKYQLRVKAHLHRRVLRLDAEVETWRRFFRTIYSTMFTGKNEAERALELILKSSGIPLIQGIQDYSEYEFIELLMEGGFARDEPDGASKR